MADERPPCPGHGTCCTRTLFDRTIFPCDQVARLWDRVLRLEAECKRAAGQAAKQEAERPV